MTNEDACSLEEPEIEIFRLILTAKAVFPTLRIIYILQIFRLVYDAFGIIVLKKYK